MQWLELTIQTSSAGIELLAERLTVLGYDSFIMDDQAEFDDFLENNKQYWDYVDEDLAKQMEGLSQIRLYLEDGPGAMEAVSDLKTQMALLKQQYPKVDLGSLEIGLANLKDEDWENNWKQYYQPLPIGKRLLVVPQWLSPENPEGRLPILLDPGMIFGTGAHASTQMCMIAMENLIHGGERVIDLGSGSGILSITALLLGAATATGVDIDPKAEDIARENAAINDLHADRFTAVTGDVIGDRTMMERLAQGGYDMVLANIVADVIIPLSQVVPHFLRKDGVFICSGILDQRLDEVRAAIEGAGLRIDAVNTMEDWCQITARLA
ncbi:MAG: 50S ribosomal protein L11 methyltransferase [Candidatus Avoscillospira sp.]